MLKLLKPAIVLLVICLIISGALAVTYGQTKDRIEESERAVANAMRAAVLPGAEFEALDIAEVLQDSDAAASPAITELYRGTAGGETAGYVATVLTKGYGGDVVVIVGIGADRKISGVRIASHSETPGLGAEAIKPKFYEQYTEQPIDSALHVVKGAAAPDGEISAISGATITSSAVTEAVNAVLAVTGGLF